MKTEQEPLVLLGDEWQGVEPNSSSCSQRSLHKLPVSVAGMQHFQDCSCGSCGWSLDMGPPW